MEKRGQHLLLLIRMGRVVGATDHWLLPSTIDVFGSFAGMLWFRLGPVTNAPNLLPLPCFYSSYALLPVSTPQAAPLAFSFAVLNPFLWECSSRARALPNQRSNGSRVKIVAETLRVVDIPIHLRAASLALMTAATWVWCGARCQRRPQQQLLGVSWQLVGKTFPHTSLNYLCLVLHPSAVRSLFYTSNIHAFVFGVFLRIRSLPLSFWMHSLSASEQRRFIASTLPAFLFCSLCAFMGKGF